MALGALVIVVAPLRPDLMAIILLHQQHPRWASNPPPLPCPLVASGSHSWIVFLSPQPLKIMTLISLTPPDLPRFIFSHGAYEQLTSYLFCLFDLPTQEWQLRGQGFCLLPSLLYLQCQESAST